MADVDVALQALHVPRLEHIADKAIGLAQAEMVQGVDGDDTGRVLAAMLQHRQCVIDRLVDGGEADETDTTAHVFFLVSVKSGWLPDFTGDFVLAGPRICGPMLAALSSCRRENRRSAVQADRDQIGQDCLRVSDLAMPMSRSVSLRSL